MGACIDKVLYEEPEPEKERPWWMVTTRKKLTYDAQKELNDRKCYKEQYARDIRGNIRYHVVGNIQSQHEINWCTARYALHEDVENRIKYALEHEDWEELHKVLTHRYGPTLANKYGDG
jgi:hypothetical protein